jgi:hypothetical protein
VSGLGVRHWKRIFDGTVDCRFRTLTGVACLPRLRGRASRGEGERVFLRSRNSTWPSQAFARHSSSTSWRVNRRVQKTDSWLLSLLTSWLMGRRSWRALWAPGKLLFAFQQIPPLCPNYSYACSPSAPRNALQRRRLKCNDFPDATSPEKSRRLCRASPGMLESRGSDWTSPCP